MHADTNGTSLETESESSRSLKVIEMAQELIDWLRRQEEHALRRRIEKRARRAKGREPSPAPGYIERVLDAGDDMEVLVWRVIRLLILFNLCAIATGVIALVVVLAIAIQQLGAERVLIIAGSTLSAVTTGGTLVWQVIRRKNKSLLEDDT